MDRDLVAEVLAPSDHEQKAILDLGPSASLYQSCLANFGFVIRLRRRKLVRARDRSTN